MALGNIRQQAEFDTVYGVNYKIRIYDSSWSGATSDFKVQPPGFDLTYDGRGKDRNHEIKASSVTIYALSENATFDTFTQAIREGAQGRFRVEILRGGSLYWRGTILADVGSEAMDSYPNSVTLRAVDGLSLMKDIPLNTDVYTGGLGSTTQHIEVIQNMLKYYSNTLDFYGASDDFLRTSVNWYEADQPTPAAGVDPLEYSASVLTVFQTFTAGATKYSSAYDVLKALCRVWGARIFQSNGVWCFFQESAYREDARFRNYHHSTTSPDDNALISTLQSTAGTKQDAQNFIMLSGGQKSYYPTLKKTRTVYGDWSNNVLWNEDYTLNNGSAPSLQTNVAYVPNTADSSLQAQFNCKIDLPITTEDPISGDYYWGTVPGDFFGATGSLNYNMTIHVIIKVGSYYYTNSGWQLAAGNYVSIIDVGGMYAAAESNSDPIEAVEIQITTPPAAGQLEFGAWFDVYCGNWTQDTASELFRTACAVDFEFIGGANGPFNPYPFQGNTITFIQDGDIFAEREFVSENTSSPANAELDLGTQLLGDGPNGWNNGRIMVSDDASTWSIGTEASWQAFGSGTTANISKILVQQFQAGQQQSIPMLQCGFIMDPTASNFLQFGGAITFESQKYIANGWSYSAYDETYKGEWYLTTSDFTGLTETEVIQSSETDSVWIFGW